MKMKTDIEIAQECTMEPITAIAEKAGIPDEYLEQYGKYKAKIDYNFLKKSQNKDGKLILVTAINPTPAGEKITSRHRYIILVFILLLLLRYLYRLFSVELLSGLYNGYFLYRLRWPLNYR